MWALRSLPRLLRKAPRTRRIRQVSHVPCADRARASNGHRLSSTREIMILRVFDNPYIYIYIVKQSCNRHRRSESSGVCRSDVCCVLHVPAAGGAGGWVGNRSLGRGLVARRACAVSAPPSTTLISVELPQEMPGVGRPAVHGAGVAQHTSCASGHRPPSRSPSTGLAGFCSD